MNKKFLSAILFGALMVTSTGTFVSCKDYDDDIENLQGQINNLATKSDVEAKLSQLQSAIDAAKTEALAAAKAADNSEEIAALEAEIAALEKCSCDVDAMLAKVQESVDADMAGYKAEIAALIEKAEALVGDVADYVTSVELNYQGVNEAYALDFYSVREKTNVFEEGLTGALTFEAGKQTQAGKTPIIVRVSPTNAVLAPEMISLVNSKGENLDEYVEFKVEKYTGLLSRAATNNGLWKITPVLKKYDEKQFAAMKSVEVSKGVFEDIQYAIQVNNALTTAEARYATSAYDITMGGWNEFEGANNLCFTVDGLSVLKINNRFDASSKSLPKFSDTSAKMYKELIWKGENDFVVGPAATEKVEKDDPATKENDINVTGALSGEPDGWWSTFDNRSDLPAALAVQGKAITIAIDNGVKDDDYEGKIAGLYVTLDYKANAVESEPSEWNAWNSYKYTGLNTVVAGTSTTITIDSEETINDYIGFRVYAVNLDGTLVDPDGRAFYVLVGEQAAETQTISATMTPTNVAASHTTVKVALTEAQSAVITNLVTKANSNSGVKMYAKNPVISEEYPVAYDVTFTMKDKKAVEAVFTLGCDIANLINDKTYLASMVYYTESGHTMGEVNFELTKTMPSAFPTDFAFRPKQETADGSGKFIAYMIPEGNSYVVADAYATAGIKDLDNVFYGLDEYYKFVFGTSKYDADKKVDINSDAVTNEDGYIHEVVTKYIDNTTAHAVSVWYTYPGISTYSYTKDGKEVWAIGEAWEVKYDKALEAVYACWEDASAFVWGTYKSEDGKSTLSHKPALQWTSEGVGEKANLSDIESTNSYNNDYFGLDLESLISTEGWLKLAGAADKVENPIKLVVNNQVNPYFVPSIEGSEIIFTQVNTQVDAAPVADHEETLVITLVDAFGHLTEISLDVTVKAPEKK